jgi:hypothetical protein
MKRLIVAAVALTLAVGLQPQAARAQTYTTNSGWDTIWYWISHGQPFPLVLSGWIVGAGTGVASYYATKKYGNPAVRHVSYGTAYGVGTLGCAVVYPMVATVLINRPLTPREAYMGVGDCAVPLIGGWLVDLMLPHDPWIDGVPPRAVHHHHS